MNAPVNAPATAPATALQPACRVDQVAPESGVAVWVHDRAVAVFRDHEDRFYALSNIDPRTGASVLSRGIVGTRAGETFVASPLHKQAFRLRDGVCLDDPTLHAPTHEVRIVDDMILIGPPASGDG